MGRNSIFCTTQKAWLAARYQRFRDAQDASSTPAFFTAVLEEWFASYPAPSGISQESLESVKIEYGRVSQDHRISPMLANDVVEIETQKLVL